MSKKFLNDFQLPDEGDIIDRIAKEQEFLSKQKKIQKNSVYDNEAQQLKEKTDFLALVDYLKQKIKRNGLGYLTECPVCKHNPHSLIISDKTKRYRCAKCDESGDMIDYIKHVKSTDFKGALKELRNLLFEQEKKKEVKKQKDKESDLSHEEQLKALSRIKQNLGKESVSLAPAIEVEPAGSSPLSKRKNGNESVSRQKVINEVIESYHRTLMSSREAYARMDNLHIKKNDLIKRFKYGFCDNTTPEKVSSRQLQILSEAGLITDSGEEYFNHNIVLPVFAEDETSVKALVPITADGKKQTVYFTDEKILLYNSKALTAYNEIILVDSVYIALLFIMLGFENTVSFNTPLTELTKDHFNKLKNQRVKKIYLALSGNSNKEAETLKTLPLHQGLSVSLLFPPEGREWTGYLRSETADSKTVRNLLKNTEAAEPDTDTSVQFTKHKSGFDFVFPNGVHYSVLNFRTDSPGPLKAVLKCTFRDNFHCDNIDLYSFRNRDSYAKTLEIQTGIHFDEAKNQLLYLLNALEEIRTKALEGEKKQESREELTDEQTKRGMEILTDPEYFDNLDNALELSGCVGENTNKILLFLAMCSRLRANPLSVYILGRSSGGKSWLAKQVLKYIPDDGKYVITTVSKEVLYYMKQGLSHKVVMLGEFEGAEKVEYILRELVSEGSISKLVTLKDPEDGQLKPFHMVSQGPISLVSTSTDPDLNPENLSRSIVLQIDESAEQTQRIFRYQRMMRTKKGYYTKKQAKEMIKDYWSANRLLKDIAIFNTFEDELDFPGVYLLARRAHFNFLGVLEMVAFVLQYQHEIKSMKDEETGKTIEYIETNLNDYEITYNLMMDGVLENTMDDLPRNAKDLHRIMREMIAERSDGKEPDFERVFLERRDILLYSGAGWSAKQIERHTKILLDHGWLEIVSGSTNGQRHKYRVLNMHNRVKDLLKTIPTPEQIRKKIIEKGKGKNEKE